MSVFHVQVFSSLFSMCISCDLFFFLLVFFFVDVVVVVVVVVVVIVDSDVGLSLSYLS